MSATGKFPLPFRSVRTLSGGIDRDYIIGAMFTADYEAKAQRLAATCEKFELSYAIHEVPAVHRSISERGNDDLSYTKPNFIRHLLAEHKRPVLYLDADCEIVSRPALMDKLAVSCDFAIYNYCADEYTDRFVPAKVGASLSKGDTTHRYYCYAGAVDCLSQKQLVCNGPVQFYGNSLAARALLTRWHQTIATFPGCLDDEALGFTFNNLTQRSWLTWLLKPRWLPKSYARISWWIYVEPVINHPGIPGRPKKLIPIKDPRGRRVFYTSQVKWIQPTLLFPRDCLIDTERRMLCKIVDGQPVAIEPVKQQLWL